jgi:uroporphyrin-III C-methyltransferase
VLASRIRKDLEAQFGPEYGPWTAEIGRTRSELLAANVPAQERLERLQQLCAAGPSSDAGTPEANGTGEVYFVGAGPGDPELLTRRAWNVLRSADVVLHDALVSPEILLLAGTRARVIDAGKRCGNRSVTQEQIHEQLIDHARAGRRVVRLQGGDPLIFGRAGEEMAALRAAGIGFEVVPGVTSASAAAAAAQISLTHRKLASRLIFLSAHQCKGDFAAGWESVASRDATLAIYMPGGKYELIARELLSAGLPGSTPCVIVSQASTARQLILRAELSSLAVLPEPPSPALLLIGEVTRAEALEAATVWGAGGEAFSKEERETVG